MLIRSAFLVGQAKPNAEDQFRQLIDSLLVPTIRALPGVSGARALWPIRREDSPPDIACQILVEFQTRDHMDRMLASAERRAMREQMVGIKALFEGAISHIEYEVA